MNPESEPLRGSKLHNLKAGYGDGMIIALDCTGVLLGTLFEAVGGKHCFVGRQVAAGDITDFFSETRIADRSSRAKRKKASSSVKHTHSLSLFHLDMSPSEDILSLILYYIHPRHFINITPSLSLLFLHRTQL